jgi:voltage-gated sodium channel
MDNSVAREGFFQVAGAWVESARIQNFITILIIVNAIVLGLETSPTVVAAVGPILTFLDHAILAVFVVELALRIGYRGEAFFRDGWNLFDLFVVGIALAPTSDSLAVLRALRVLRVLRLITALPRLKMVVQALLSSLPGLGMIMLLQGLIFYVGAVISTKLFAADFPEWFGSIGASLYTLFQVMTLESWSMGIVRPVMEKFPLAWIFFVPFILVATFTMLNLFIAVIVNAMQSLHEAEVMETTEEIRAAAHTETETVMEELRRLRGELTLVRQTLEKRGD